MLYYSAYWRGKVMDNSKNLSQKSIIDSALVGGLIVAFFVVTVLMYYNMLFAEKKDSIIKEGEISAQNAVASVESYVYYNSSFVSFTSYALENMLEEGCTHDDIQSFLEAQSSGIINSYTDNFTGVDGYIRGQFHSGNGWEAPADFDATSRPWYKNAIDGHGMITILEPYQDIQSGKYNLAIGKGLNDGESVISIDVSLDNIQKITEQAAADKKTDMLVIINEAGTVIAHTDASQVGRDYSKEQPGSFDYTLYTVARYNSQKLREHNHFEFKDNGRNYIVYAVPILDNWKCISIADVTSIYNSIRTILIATIVMIGIIVFIVWFIMNTAGKRSVLAENAMAENEAKKEFLFEKSEELRKAVRKISHTKDESVKPVGDHLEKIAAQLLEMSGREADTGGAEE